MGAECWFLESAECRAWRDRATERFHARVTNFKFSSFRVSSTVQDTFNSLNRDNYTHY